ncbi:MAG: PepSY domain-containing protein [Sandaracinaceae bacterium]|nr:PepSY domain-containing protein [Sandaracinaceae bacterium]
MKAAPIAGLVSLALALTAASPGVALAQADFETSGDAWNSVSQLMRIAEERGRTVEIPERFDVGTLDPSDSLLILSPSRELPGAGLTAFLRDGGRACVADDFGEADTFLALFSIARALPSAPSSMLLRGNDRLPVARPIGTHELARGVNALVTNHPAVVRHRELAPIFELGDGEAIVLAGAVGEGRLVVLADPSVLIDNMMALNDNRRFAENLVDYLGRDRPGRLVVVRPDVAIVGRYGEPGADRPLHDLRALLERLSRLDVPPLALRIASLALAAIAVILALGALPRRSPYRSARMFAREAAHGGFVGRVGFFARPGVDLSQPLMVYKFEVEAEILRRLSFSGTALLRDVLTAMRAAGHAEPDIADMQRLLLSLDRLHAAQDGPTSPPTVGERQFRELVRLGDALLEKLAR